jgi:alkyl sulfatase BDS1-like metallo-beta-lactamase superfamily hydrolase
MGNPDIAATMPIPLLLRAFVTRLNPALSEGMHLQVGFRCTDTATDYSLAIRSDVAEILTAAPADSQVAIQTTDPTLRGLLAGQIAWLHAVENGSATLSQGTAEDATHFWSLFDPPARELPALALR